MESIIPHKTLISYGATVFTYKADEALFDQGTLATHYYQVKTGEIKMAHINGEGTSFIQGIFTKGQSFGEPALFGNLTYPCGAIAIVDSEVYKLPALNFFQLLEGNFTIHKKFNQILSERLCHKGNLLNEISSYPSAHRIQSALNYLKDKYGQNGIPFEVPFTRQDLADMTGLRVETVIRVIKQLEKDSALTIVKGKIMMT